MTLVMYDAIDPRQFLGLTGVDALAGYVDGRWPTYKVLDRFAPPGVHLLSIAVFPIDNADCLDVEPGDATNAQAPFWVHRQIGAGTDRPCVYTSVSNADALVSTLNGAGLPRHSFRVWSAHYGGGEHICGPASCKLTSVTCDGTQWTDNAHGRSLDQSLLLGSFFGTDPPAATSQEIEMFAITTGKDAITPVPIPAGCKRVRFFTNGAADLHIDLMSAGTDVDLHTGYDNPNGFAVPSGCQAVVVHRTDDGTAQVNACYSF